MTGAFAFLPHSMVTQGKIHSFNSILSLLFASHLSSLSPFLFSYPFIKDIIIKNTDEEVHKVRSRKVLSAEASVPMERVCQPPCMWVSVPTWNFLPFMILTYIKQLLDTEERAPSLVTFRGTKYIILGQHKH